MARVPEVCVPTPTLSLSHFRMSTECGPLLRHCSGQFEWRPLPAPDRHSRLWNILSFARSPFQIPLQPKLSSWIFTSLRYCNTPARPPASQPVIQSSFTEGTFYIARQSNIPFSLDTFFAESNIIHPAAVNNLIMPERKGLRNRICDLLSDPICEKLKSLHFAPHKYAALRAMASDLTTAKKKTNVFFAVDIRAELRVITAQESR